MKMRGEQGVGRVRAYAGSLAAVIMSLAVVVLMAVAVLSVTGCGVQSAGNAGVQGAGSKSGGQTRSGVASPVESPAGGPAVSPAGSAAVGPAGRTAGSVLGRGNGRTVVILGDSYSTFEGYVPEGFAIWYDSNIKDENDVCKVEQTWWYQLVRKERLKLLGNNSYSGSTVCNTGYDGADYSDRSFITRMPQTLGYSADKPDIILIFGGTNDSWANAPVGALKYEGWTVDDLKQALPAYCYMLNYYKMYAPETRVINIVNDGLKPEITEGIVAAARHYGMEYLLLEGIDKGWGHPTVKGMKQICDALEKVL